MNGRMTGSPVPALVWCPFPDAAAARTAAGILLDEGLIGCANIFPEMESLYAWQGERGGGTETGVLFKTDGRLLEKIVARLIAIHPYDEPAVLGWRCDAAAPATAAWLGDLGG